MKNIILAFITIASTLAACKDNEKYISTDEMIFNEILIANMFSATEASSKTMIGDFSLDIDDSVTISNSDLLLYFYGKDSLKGTYKNIDSTYYLKYAYRVRDNYVFRIFDNSNKFIDKGLISRREFLNVFFDDFDSQKAEFHDSYFHTLNEQYEKIQKKYSVSRKFIDSLVSTRVRSH
ncbi:MAG: hypothetical protein ACKO96_07240, partial [Flammeovirgaceae bacterium]